MQVESVPEEEAGKTERDSSPQSRPKGNETMKERESNQRKNGTNSKEVRIDFLPLQNRPSPSLISLTSERLVLVMSSGYELILLMSLWSPGEDRRFPVVNLR